MTVMVMLFCFSLTVKRDVCFKTNGYPFLERVCFITSFKINEFVVSVYYDGQKPHFLFLRLKVYGTGKFIIANYF